MLTSSSPGGFRNSRQLRKYVLAGGAVALVGTLAYQAYQSDAYGRSTKYLAKLRAALKQYIDALATGGEICAEILRDLQRFLQSDVDEVPSSLRQVSKLLQSHEFTSTTTSTVAAIYEGVTGSATSDAAQQQHGQQPAAIDKILDALLSDRGHSLVSVAVSMGAKNMVSAYVEATARAAQDAPEGPPQADSTDKLFAFLSTPEGQQLSVMAVAAFASNGMRVYMDKSLEVNFYEDMFSSMAKPHHLEAVKQCVGVFARDVVGAYLQGSSRPPPAHALQQQHVAIQENGPASGAISVDADSPSSSSNGGAIEALHGSSGVRRLADDLDSDSLLHSRKKKGSGGGDGQMNTTQWISAVGKEWLNLSRDADSRHAMTAVVGTATREVVAGVSSVVVDRFSPALLAIVMLIGVMSAVIVQRLAGMMLG